MRTPGQKRPLLIDIVVVTLEGVDVRVTADVRSRRDCSTSDSGVAALQKEHVGLHLKVGQCEGTAGLKMN